MSRSVRLRMLAGSSVLLLVIGAVGASLWWRHEPSFVHLGDGRFAIADLRDVPTDGPLLIDLGTQAKSEDLPRFLAIDRTAHGVQVLVAIDTHDGCRLMLAKSVPVEIRHRFGNADWERAAFVDPCHGGMYGRDGSGVGGPVAQGLASVAADVHSEGRVVADLKRPTPGPGRTVP